MRLVAGRPSSTGDWTWGPTGSPSCTLLGGQSHVAGVRSWGTPQGRDSQGSEPGRQVVGRAAQSREGDRTGQALCRKHTAWVPSDPTPCARDGGAGLGQTPGHRSRPIGRVGTEAAAGGRPSSETGGPRSAPGWAGAAEGLRCGASRFADQRGARAAFAASFLAASALYLLLAAACSPALPGAALLFASRLPAPLMHALPGRRGLTPGRAGSPQDVSLDLRARQDEG